MGSRSPVSGVLELGDALRTCRRRSSASVIALINLLYLTGSIFILEVYDRVLPKPQRADPFRSGYSCRRPVQNICPRLLDLIRGRNLVSGSEPRWTRPSTPACVEPWWRSR